MHEMFSKGKGRADAYAIGAALLLLTQLFAQSHEALAQQPKATTPDATPSGGRQATLEFNRTVKDGYTGPRVTKVVFAVDVGLPINPLGLQAQMMGGSRTRSPRR